MLRAPIALLCLVCLTPAALAQTVSQRGFAEARATVFPRDAPNDSVNLLGDLLVREEAFVEPADWIQFAAGVDLSLNTHGQVDTRRRIDVTDRTPLRPLVGVRRLSATLHRRWLTVDAGKQFIRWGKTDIVTPTDHFAPRDFLNVVDDDFMAVSGVRGVVQARAETAEVVVVPRFTPSRTPLVDQRWTTAPAGAEGLRLVDGGPRFPEGTQVGARWSHVGDSIEYSLSYFRGFNHLPNIQVHVPFVPGELVLTRVYPAISSYGAAVAAPTRWFTVKGESAYFRSPDPATDEYILYVVQLERLAGEWLLVGGYAGEIVTERRAPLTFSPDRGLARSLVGRASYTIDVNRTASLEGAIRQNGTGGYAQAEFSQALGSHWRMTVAGSVIAGRDGDFLGQYRRNSRVSAALRYSF